MFKIESINNQLRKLEFPGLVKCVLYDKLFSISKLDIVELHLSFGIKPLYLIAGQLYEACSSSYIGLYTRNKKNAEQFEEDWSDTVDQLENVEGEINIKERFQMYTQRCYFSALVKRIPSMAINNGELLDSIRKLSEAYNKRPVDFIELNRTKSEYAADLLHFHLTREINPGNVLNIDSIIVSRKEGRLLVTRTGDLLKVDQNNVIDERIDSSVRPLFNTEYANWLRKYQRQMPCWYAEVDSFEDYITECHNVKNKENTYMQDLIRLFVRHFGVYNRNLFVAYQPPLVPEHITTPTETTYNKPSVEVPAAAKPPVINEKIEDINQINNIMKLLELYIEKAIDKKLDELTSPNNK